MAIQKVRTRGRLPRVYVGVDPSSTQLAVVSQHEDKPAPELHHIALRGDLVDKTHQAMGWSRALCRDLAERYGPVLVYVSVEAPFVGKFAGAGIALARAQGAVIAGWVDGGASVFEVKVPDWKKVVIGSGAAGKPLVAAWVEANWTEAYAAAMTQRKGIQQDLLDAAAICRYTMTVIGE